VHNTINKYLLYSFEEYFDIFSDTTLIYFINGVILILSDLASQTHYELFSPGARYNGY